MKLQTSFQDGSPQTSSRVKMNTNNENRIHFSLTYMFSEELSMRCQSCGVGVPDELHHLFDGPGGGVFAGELQTLPLRRQSLRTCGGAGSCTKHWNGINFFSCSNSSSKLQSDWQVTFIWNSHVWFPSQKAGAAPLTQRSKTAAVLICSYCCLFVTHKY